MAVASPSQPAVSVSAEHLHITHSLQARQHVPDLDHRVIAQIQRVVATIRRLQEHHHGEVRRALLSDQTNLPYHVGQTRLRLRHAVLCLHLRDIEVGSEPEGHRDGEVAVGSRHGVGIDGILDAVDLLLERRDDGLGDGLGRGAGILPAHHHGGRHDLRVFADRE